MHCAVVSEKRINYLVEFCNEIEEALEVYNNSRDDGEDREVLIAKIKEHGNVGNAIRHLITAYETIYNSACNKELDYLDFTPEIKQFLDAKETKEPDVQVSDTTKLNS